MGGDAGIETTVPAAVGALRSREQLTLLLVGDEAVLAPLLAPYVDEFGERLRLVHASECVEMDESPGLALKNKKDSSMRVAINLVRSGEAAACVSSGNTGALMATAKFVLKTLPGIDRPAIMALFPTQNEHDVRVLDLGANVDGEPEQLLQFAVMGSIASQLIDGIASPRVGLLNIGSEEMKGNAQVKAAADLLSSNSSLNYIGYVEGNAMFEGVADVVVCDGFVGNIALKTGEGISKLIARYAKEEFTRDWPAKMAATLVMPILKRIARRIDPRERNGATLLGLNGVVIKSHGGADEFALMNAIEEAAVEVNNQLPLRIGDALAEMLT